MMAFLCHFRALLLHALSCPFYSGLRTSRRARFTLVLIACVPAAAGVPKHPADFNQDETVDLRDWGIFADTFGAGKDDPFASPIPFRPADLDADGDVDAQDFEIFLESLLGPVHPFSRPCAADVDCFDGNPCTKDFCDVSSCFYFQSEECCYNDFACQDFDRCTNTCRNNPPTCDVPVRFCCWNDSHCDDGNACTDDSCDLKKRSCVYSFNQAPCNDGNACTLGDECIDGTCKASDVVTCPGGDQCNTRSCDPATGGCITTTDPNGTPCDDGNACTLGDECIEGTCTPSEVVMCPGGDQCNTRSCDPATGGCITTNQPNGTPCNDGSLCTLEETCLNGVCTPAQTVFCLGGTQCVPRLCNPATGACAAAPRPDGSPCNDGNVCTLTDTCQQGVCQGSVPVSCSPCEVFATCHPQLGCGGLRETGSVCSDGDDCTTGDSCYYGVCTPGTECTAGHDCCPGIGCVNLLSDNAHCGACNNACVNKVCFQGSCVDGCVIGGVSYIQGAKNPYNPCEMCDTTHSRTLWKPLDVQHSCSIGCFIGQCFQGACASLGGTGGCPTTTCATSSCHPITQQCEFTAINEGGACTPSLTTSSCRSATAGTCQSGQCVGNLQNVGSSCVLEPWTVVPNDCYSDVEGTCNALGQCIAERLPEGSTCGQPPPCSQATCKTFIGIFDCWQSPVTCNPPPAACGAPGNCDPTSGQCVYPGPHPASGVLSCGGWVSGYHPESCCEGMVCVCAPLNFACLAYECWWPDDLPDLTPE